MSKFHFCCSFPKSSIFLYFNLFLFQLTFNINSQIWVTVQHKE